MQASYSFSLQHITRGEEDHGSSILEWCRVLGRGACDLRARGARRAFPCDLSGFNELGALNAETGAIFSNGTATLDLDLDERAQTLTFKLTLADLSSAVTQAHIHFGQPHVPGNMMVFFCTNLGNTPEGITTA